MRSFAPPPTAAASDAPKSFISRLQSSITGGLPSCEGSLEFRTDELQLVRGVLQMLQGFPSSLFYWDAHKQEFCAKNGIYTPHLSQASLLSVLNPFIFGGTCLKQVELFVKMVEVSPHKIPTLRAFTNSISLWLERLRKVCLELEKSCIGSALEATSTLLQLGSSLSSVCSGAEYLLQVVYGAIPHSYLQSQAPIPASEFAVHILDYLFLKLDEVCLVHDGEDDAYYMLLAIFISSLLPYLDGLHSWLCDGTLDDPYEEMFFVSNSAITVDQPEFWEKGYLFRMRLPTKACSSASPLRTAWEPTMQNKREMSEKQRSSASLPSKGTFENDMENIVCPLFLKDIAKAIVSAGKSLQLAQHGADDCFSMFNKERYCSIDHLSVTKDSTSSALNSNPIIEQAACPGFCKSSNNGEAGESDDDKLVIDLLQVLHKRGLGWVTLSDVFLISFVGLIGDGIKVYGYLSKPCLWSPDILKICKAYVEDSYLVKEKSGNAITDCSAIWFKFLVDVMLKKNSSGEISQRELTSTCKTNDGLSDWASIPFYPENPVLSMCQSYLLKNKDIWDVLNISMHSQLPPLNEETLRRNVFGENYTNISTNIGLSNGETSAELDKPNIKLSEFKYAHQPNNIKTIDSLFPFPTFLPCLQENFYISELIPFQKNSTLASNVLRWMQSVNPKFGSLPNIIIQNCLILYIRRQVDYVGKYILSKLMNGWGLMAELGVLRAVYLLGSGDLLQQFLVVAFDKLDRGDSWGDDFEWNTMLQESIRNSADGAVLGVSDSLVISIAKPSGSDDQDSTHTNLSCSRKSWNYDCGIDALDQLKFMYKVSWPLDLIINSEAIKKYNQVMSFLLKVKRAKSALDKARKWMWKRRGKVSYNQKHHLLVEQKLLHFVDAFHQYVMDRVLHSAWLDLCNGMASAMSLDEVIEVHETYLLSIQRQCFVAPDKLWALIASRVKIVLGLALEFYSIQQTLASGGAASGVKSRCEMEVDRIEKQFDECIAFLLRILSFKLNVGHFPHLADLVTRINYSYFYMSESGNLLTAPSNETRGSKMANVLQSSRSATFSTSTHQ